MGSSSRPLVSFVIPCYNYGHYLAECLTSIFQQEAEHPFEIIAVDDGSTDNTQEILRSVSDPRLRVITHSKNLGHARTINDGLSQAQGVFVARIDPDDRYRPHFLSATLEKFHSFPDVGMVYGDVALIDERGRTTAEHSDRVHEGKDFKGNELIRLLEKNFICSPTVIARREAWQRASPVPEHLAFHDWYFTLMMAREFDFYYIDGVLADYRVHPMNYHSQIARSGAEERSLFWLLDKVFQERERSEEMESQKQRARRRIYAAHFADLADKYFWFGMNADSKRCYLLALKYHPRLVTRLGLLRRLFGTVIGPKAYGWAKSFGKSFSGTFRGSRGRNP